MATRAQKIGLAIALIIVAVYLAQQIQSAGGVSEFIHSLSQPKH